MLSRLVCCPANPEASLLQMFFSEIEDFDAQEQFVMRWRGNITVRS
eukprot:COSAG04_NODE_1326_length_7211_cov_1.774606_9_plen_46_part_00